MPLLLRADNVQCLVVRKPHRPKLAVQKRRLPGSGVNAYFGGFQHGVSNSWTVCIYSIKACAHCKTLSSAGALPACIPALNRARVYAGFC